MAADSNDSIPEGASSMEDMSESEEDVQWANQQGYQERTSETEDVVLPDGQMKMRVRVMRPQKFASLIEEHGITEMAQELGELPEQADISDTGDVDLDEIDTEDLEELDNKFGLILFLKNVVKPQIVKPERVHWADPEHIADPNWFDLSGLTDRDLTFLIGQVTGQDPDQLAEAAQDRVEKFPE